MSQNLVKLQGELLELSRVQFITHFTERYSYIDSVHIALEGGCRWIQLRMKDVDDEEFVIVGREVKELCRSYGAILIINDRLHLADEIGADGVHLGLNDISISKARQILASSLIIGGTANSIEDIQSHIAAGADYVGCGPFRFTETKKNLSPLLGIEGYRRISEAKYEKSIPMIAIGGITVEDIPQIIMAGMSGIALSGSVLRAEEPIKYMRNIIALVNDYLSSK